MRILVVAVGGRLSDLSLLDRSHLLVVRIGYRSLSFFGCFRASKSLSVMDVCFVGSYVVDTI